MRFWGAIFTGFLVMILLGALAIALDWPIRSSMIVYWIAGVGIPLCVWQIWRDLNPLTKEKINFLTLVQEPSRTEAARRTFSIFWWIAALVAGVLLFGFHITLPTFVIVYVRSYGGSWRAAVILALFALVFLVGAFDMLIAVIWPSPLLFELFGFEYFVRAN